MTLWLECCRKTSKKKHVRFVSLKFTTFVAIDLKDATDEALSRVELSFWVLWKINSSWLCRTENCTEDYFDFGFICSLPVRYCLDMKIAVLSLGFDRFCSCQYNLGITVIISIICTFGYFWTTKLSFIDHATNFFGPRTRITNCDNFITKCDDYFEKVRQVLQRLLQSAMILFSSATILLQSATGQIASSRFATISWIFTSHSQQKLTCLNAV